MTVDDLVGVCGRPQPPVSLPTPLLALYWDARGDWKKAHEVAQGIKAAEGSLIHAYLHRKEGDHGNAAYWYGQAGRPVNKGTLAEEWRAIAQEICALTAPGPTG